jgi:nuclear pore complex protein Nup93
MQRKMMVYNGPVTECNLARLKGISYPIIHSLARASLSLNADVCSSFTFLYRSLGLLLYSAAELTK